MSEDDDRRWNEFLLALRAAGGSRDMQTNKTGRYPWLFHFCRGQESTLVDVVVYARTSVRLPGGAPRLTSP